jgi:ribosomal protein S18 acetylase RimI-like enzyme
MPGPDDLLARACDAWWAYLALGNEVIERPGARFVRCPATPRVHDANHVSGLRTGTAAAFDAVLARAEEVFAGAAHRFFLLDPLTPAHVEARLVHEGYEGSAELALVLEGELRARPDPVAIRLADGDADWRSLHALQRLDDEERCKRRGLPLYAEDVTRGLVERRRAKAPAVRTWIAEVERRSVGYLSSWPGQDGIGKVEDLFVHPSERRRGVATALLDRGVSDARARGAAAVLIGADPSDTPRHLYARLGFRPLCVLRGYLRRVAGVEKAGAA